MPFILISGAADRVNVEAARERGVSEFMAKPFSVENVYKVIQRLIDNPRQFVTTHSYFGPDRRRSKAGPPMGSERRKPDESHGTIVYAKDRVEKAKTESEMGSNAAKNPFVLPFDVLQAAETELKREAEGFIGWAKAYLDRLSSQVGEAKGKFGERTANLEEINLIAHELRGQGGTFGYPLITIFAKSLYEVTKPPCPQDDAMLEIVKAHIDTMRAVIREDIEGDGGDIGQQLFKSLKLATAKYSKQAGENAAGAPAS
jgi:hypothetical protein